MTTEFLLGFLGALVLALVPHALMIFSLGLALFVLWHFWHWLLLALAAIPLLLLAGALSIAALYAMSLAGAWVGAWIFSGPTWLSLAICLAFLGWMVWAIVRGEARARARLMTRGDGGEAA
jgi:hypothetical protein